MRAVAREVGISAPSIYLHFKDRTELVAEVARRAYARLIEDLRASLHGIVALAVSVPFPIDRSIDGP